MNVVRHAAPELEPVSLQEAKAHLRVTATDEDDVIERFIVGAREEAEGFQNRAFITQEWEGWLDEFPDEDHIDLPLPPLQTVEAIHYYNTAGTEATMTATDYIVDATGFLGRVVLAYGKTWPSTTLRPAKGVVVEFTCGYGDDAADVPEKIRHAILLGIGERYEQRENTVPGTRTPEVPSAAERLLRQDRVVPV